MLVPVLAGYWFLSHTHVLKRAYSDKSNYELFFASAIYGGGFFVVAWISVATFQLFCPDCLGWIGEAWCRIAPFNHSGVLALTVALACAGSVGTNVRISDKEAAARWAVENENRIGWILRESLERRRLVEVSLTNGKSYVGFVVDEDPGGWERDVALLPVLSGYRNSRTRRLVLTKNYAALGAASLRGNAVVLSMNEVVSICRFDTATHRDLKSRGRRSAA